MDDNDGKIGAIEKSEWAEREGSGGGGPDRKCSDRIEKRSAPKGKAMGGCGMGGRR